MGVKIILENYNSLPEDIREEISRIASEMIKDLSNKKVIWRKMNGEYVQKSRNPKWYSELWWKHANKKPDRKTPLHMKSVNSKISRKSTLETLLSIKEGIIKHTFHTIEVLNIIYEKLPLSMKRRTDLLRYLNDSREIIKDELSRGVSREVLEDIGYETRNL